MAVEEAMLEVDLSEATIEEVIAETIVESNAIVDAIEKAIEEVIAETIVESNATHAWVDKDLCYSIARSRELRPLALTLTPTTL